jgi:hypothetical protein
MAGSVNKVILVGNLGRDPEVRTFQNGGKVCNLRIATSETLEGQAVRRAAREDRMAFGRDLLRTAGADRRAVSEEGLEGLHRGPARDPQVAGPVGPGPLHDRDRAAPLPGRADAARRARRRRRRRRLPGGLRRLRRPRRLWRRVALGRWQPGARGRYRRRDPVLTRDGPWASAEGRIVLDGVCSPRIPPAPAWTCLIGTNSIA